jgi:hypothetical protein
LNKNRIPNYKSLLPHYFILTFYFNYKKQIMFSKITLMIGFMLLSTGALQAQDKPELEIGGAVFIIIYPLGKKDKKTRR